MSRLLSQSISEAIRTAAAAATWTSLGTLAAIPTGRDPRAYVEDSRFPQIVIQLTGTKVRPRSIGGGLEAGHRLVLWALFAYDDGQDLNLAKLAVGEELFDFVCDNRAGTNYRLLASDGPEGGDITIDYDTAEEIDFLAAGMSVAVVRLECPLTQRPIFNITGS